MIKKCPNCHKELPEEAAFCLYCNTVLTKDAAGKATKDKNKKKAVRKEQLNKKKTFTYIGMVAAFILLMGICITALKYCNSDSSVKPVGTTIKTVTSTVAVTEENGEPVTDAQGEQVFDIVTVTEVEVLTTKKHNIFDKVFNNNSDKTDNPGKNDNNNTGISDESTTKKGGFFDKLFGKDDVDTTTEKNDTAGKTDSQVSDAIPETTKKESFFDKLFGDDEEDTEEEVKTTGSAASTTKENGATVAPTAPETNEPTATITPTHPTSTTTTQPATSAPTSTTTTKPTESTNTTKPPEISSVLSSENSSYYFEYEPQYKSNPEGNIALTKYIGNASVVTIPSYVDGRKVAAIREDCFKNDSKIKEINFDDSTTYTISLYSHCFNNLTSLTKVVFNNKGVHIDSPFAYNCPILYLGKDGKTDNKLIDGAYYKGSVFYWFSAHPSFTVLTFPDWCTKIDNNHNLNEVPNLKVINIHRNVTNVPYMSLRYSQGLSAINVENGHPLCFSKDGVLFSKLSQNDSTYSYCIYPYSKTDSVFKMPQIDTKCTLGIGPNSAVIANQYLEELWLPSNGYLYAPDSKYFYETCYCNLKRIYIHKDHPQYDKISKTFKGELIVKDF